MVFPKRLQNFSEHYAPFVAAIGRHDALRDKRVLVFYINPRGSRFLNFPVGRDPRMSFLEFTDADLGPADYYRVDDHLVPDGHKKVARHLDSVIRHAAAVAAPPEGKGR